MTIMTFMTILVMTAFMLFCSVYHFVIFTVIMVLGVPMEST